MVVLERLSVFALSSLTAPGVELIKPDVARRKACTIVALALRAHQKPVASWPWRDHGGIDSRCPRRPEIMHPRAYRRTPTSRITQHALLRTRCPPSRPRSPLLLTRGSISTRIRVPRFRGPA